MLLTVTNRPGDPVVDGVPSWNLPYDFLDVNRPGSLMSSTGRGVRDLNFHEGVVLALGLPGLEASEGMPLLVALCQLKMLASRETGSVVGVTKTGDCSAVEEDTAVENSGPVALDEDSVLAACGVDKYEVDAGAVGD